MARLENLEEALGVAFKRPELLKEALTHRSYLNENPSWGFPHNERLEFLGDAVLELAVTEFLYEKFPDADEGKLTGIRAALVNYQMLASVAENIPLGNYLFLSKGEAKESRGRAREVILANAFEAVVGAVYLDRGYTIACTVVKELLVPRLEEVMEKKLYKDPKSMLQEMLQEHARVTPMYRVLSESGPDHAKEFVVGVFRGAEKLGEGKGASKQEAEAAAAERVLKEIREAPGA